MHSRVSTLPPLRLLGLYGAENHILGDIITRISQRTCPGPSMHTAFSAAA